MRRRNEGAMSGSAVPEAGDAGVWSAADIRLEKMRRGRVELSHCGTARQLFEGSRRRLKGKAVLQCDNARCNSKQGKRIRVRRGMCPPMATGLKSRSCPTRAGQGAPPTPSDKTSAAPVEVAATYEGAVAAGAGGSGEVRFMGVKGRSDTGRSKTANAIGRPGRFVIVGSSLPTADRFPLPQAQGISTRSVMDEYQAARFSISVSVSGLAITPMTSLARLPLR